MPDGPATHHNDPETSVSAGASTSRSWEVSPGPAGPAGPDGRFEPATAGIDWEHQQLGRGGLNAGVHGGYSLGGSYRFNIEFSFEHLLLGDLPAHLPNISILDPSVSVEVVGGSPAQTSVGLTVLHWQWEYLGRITAEAAVAAASRHFSDGSWMLHAEAGGRVEAMVLRRVGLFMSLNVEVDHTVGTAGTPGGPTNVGISSVGGVRVVLDPTNGQVQQRH